MTNGLVINMNTPLNTYLVVIREQAPVMDYEIMKVSLRVFMLGLGAHTS